MLCTREFGLTWKTRWLGLGAFFWHTYTLSNFSIDYTTKGFDNDPTICEHGPKHKLVDIVW